MRLMRRHNPQLREDGFQLLLLHAGEHLDDLIEEFEQEQNQGLRCWLLELIAEAQSPNALSVPAAELDNQDISLRDWAVRGLQRLNSHEARTLLWQARANGTIPEDEHPPRQTRPKN
ncbi:HEAT repeat domain-containing protein [Nocardia sp. SYP-A9097]|nr:HEAT repeat domain-containing protein [Nocardia sp. SYP-A9097]